jgi:hypothetical protein
VFGRSIPDRRPASSSTPEPSRIRGWRRKFAIRILSDGLELDQANVRSPTRQAMDCHQDVGRYCKLTTAGKGCKEVLGRGTPWSIGPTVRKHARCCEA